MGETEIMTVITFASVLVGIYATVKSILKDREKNIKSDQIELTSIMFEVKTISNGIIKIEEKLSSMERDEKDSKERIIILEQSVKEVWRRIDDLSERLNMPKYNHDQLKESEKK